MGSDGSHLVSGYECVAWAVHSRAPGVVVIPVVDLAHALALQSCVQQPRTVPSALVRAGHEPLYHSGAVSYS